MNFYQGDNLFNWNNTINTSHIDPGTDHIEYNGVNMLVFEDFKNKLDPLNEGTKWRGFSPRWTLPTKIRNSQDPTFITSTILVIMDTAREIHLGIGPYFSQDTLGLSEMIASSLALRQLKVDMKDGNDKVDIFFEQNQLSVYNKFANLDRRNFFLSENIETEVDVKVNEVLSRFFKNRDNLVRRLKDTIGERFDGER